MSFDLRRFAMFCSAILWSSILIVNPVQVLAGKTDIGLPQCEQIVGVDRYIDIGNTVLYTVKYLEDNNYDCSKYLGNAQEVISCKLRSNLRAEILLAVENGMITDIETLDDGRECTYFNFKEEPKRSPDLKN